MSDLNFYIIVGLGLVVAYTGWRNDTMITMLLGFALSGYGFYSHNTGYKISDTISSSEQKFDKFVGNDKYHKNQKAAADKLKEKTAPSSKD